MTKVLVIAESEKQQLTHATYATITAAMRLAPKCDLLIASHEGTLAKTGAKLEGVEQVLLYQEAYFEHILAEDLATVILKEAQNYSHILFPATTFGKNVSPRVAAKLDVMQISDVITIENEEIFIRPIYAGNALAKVKSLDKIKILTVRPTAFSPTKEQEKEAPIIAKTGLGEQNRLVQFIKSNPSLSKRPELGSAKIVISGGRGLKSAENFKMIEQLADKLGAAVGASRAAVDAGFVSNDYQVGQTGKVIAPNLYIAVGISGAIQHLAGILESKVIVAINSDPDAPIFEVADYGLVGDLFTLLPELNAALGTEDVKSR